MKRAAQVLIFLAISTRVVSQTSPGGVLTSASCRLWVDAGDLDGDGDYTDNPALGTAVSNWDDKSGNNNDLSQGTAAFRPTYNALGGRSVVVWNNSGTNINFLNAATQSMLSPGTIYMVVRMLDAGDGANCLWDRSGAGNTSMRFEQWSGTNQVGYTIYGTSDYASTIASAYNSNLIVSYLKTGASNNVDIAVNNASVNLAVAGANAGLPLYVLGKNNATDGMHGYVFECLAYNTNLNYAQKMIIDNYLSAKYGGISIISDKYAGDDVGNGNYDYELGGVGTESGNNNQVSSSVTGGLQATQATAMGNGEYLMFAHQSTPTNSLNWTDVGGMSAGPARARWERIWYFDWTHVGGSAESVNLVFDFSDGGMGGSPVAPASNYKLLYRSGLTGNWTEVMNASSIAGDRVTFNGVAWNTVGDGYYTLGTLDNATSPLPVELSAFVAEPCGRNVCVKWETETEFNAHHFVVQRSANGLDWSEVESVPAAGDSKRRREYAATDYTPVSGISYYRLVTVDVDQTSQVSQIVAVVMAGADAVFEVFPNPASDALRVRLTGPAPDQFFLVDPTGQAVPLLPVTVSFDAISFDVARFSRGWYVLEAVLPGGTRIQRKIILR